MKNMADGGNEYQVFDCSIKIPYEAVRDGHQNEFVIGQLQEIIGALKSKSKETELGFEGKKSAEWSVHETIESVAAKEEAELGQLSPALRENKLLSSLSDLLSDKSLTNEYGLATLGDLKEKIRRNADLSPADRLLCSVYKSGAFGNTENVRENAIYYTIDKYSTVPLDNNDPKKCIESRALNFLNILKNTGAGPAEKYLRSFLVSVPDARKYIDIQATSNKILTASKLIPAKQRETTAQKENSPFPRAAQRTAIPNTHGMKLGELEIKLNVPEEKIEAGQSAHFILEVLNRISGSIAEKKNIMEIIRDENGNSVGYWKDPSACKETRLLDERRRQKNITVDEQEKELFSALKSVLKNDRFAETNSYSIVSAIKGKMDVEEELSPAEKLIYDSVMSLESMSQNFHRKITDMAVQKAAKIPPKSQNPAEISKELYIRCYKLVNIINKEPPDPKTVAQNIRHVSESFFAYLPSETKKKCNLQQKSFTQNLAALYSRMNNPEMSSQPEKKRSPAEQGREL